MAYLRIDSVDSVEDQIHESEEEPSSLSLPDSIAVNAVGLTKRFGTHHAVNSVSFRIQKGSVFGLIGPNGAGKSTTLKMLMRMSKVSAGTATVLGHDVTSDFQPIKHRIGYVPETHHIYRWMTVKRVIQFAKSFYENWNDAFCLRLMEMMELNPDKKIRHLSKGVLAKLALLIAVSHDPDLLILDEPLSGLDPIVRDDFIEGVMQTICERETTVILSSHTIDDVQRLADSVGILYEGKLLVNRPIEKLLAATKRIRCVKSDLTLAGWVPDSTVHQSVNGREWTITVDEFSPRLVEQLKSENRVDHIEVDDMNLEDIFKDFINGQRQRLSPQKGAA